MDAACYKYGQTRWWRLAAAHWRHRRHRSSRPRRQATAHRILPGDVRALPRDLRRRTNSLLAPAGTLDESTPIAQEVFKKLNHGNADHTEHCHAFTFAARQAFIVQMFSRQTSPNLVMPSRLRQDRLSSCRCFQGRPHRTLARLHVCCKNSFTYFNWQGRPHRTLSRLPVVRAQATLTYLMDRHVWMGTRMDGHSDVKALGAKTSTRTMTLDQTSSPKLAANVDVCAQCMLLCTGARASASRQLA
jgi:hypothetical protein